MFVKNSLITMYARCGSIEDADRVFSSMPERDVVSWNAMIAGYAQHGLAIEALRLFERLIQAGTKPDEITFVGVLSACSHAGLVEEAWYYFNSMVRDHCLTAISEHYACMVDLLGRAGYLEEAKKLIDEMPMEPDVVVWGSFLSACRMHVNVKLGKLAAERLFELEPGNDSTYVLLSSIYAAAEMWDDVTKVRIMMKNKGVKRSQDAARLM
jgi:pentatricopeptide repeat protein